MLVWASVASGFAMNKKQTKELFGMRGKHHQGVTKIFRVGVRPKGCYLQFALPPCWPGMWVMYYKKSWSVKEAVPKCLSSERSGGNRCPCRLSN